MKERKIHIEVQVFGGCPHADKAAAIAETTAKKFGGTIELVEVRSDAMAERIGFLGSPSFVVNGGDIEGRKTERGSLTCRLYAGEGVPPLWLLEAAIVRAQKPEGILFLCVANSARSQMAEGIARKLCPDGMMIYSAGKRPTQVRSEAIIVLGEIGIDISRYRSKAIGDVPVDSIDTVFSLCAEEECPVFFGQARHLHWPLGDPAIAKEDEQQSLAAFRETRDELYRRLSVLFRK